MVGLSPAYTKTNLFDRFVAESHLFEPEDEAERQILDGIQIGDTGMRASQALFCKLDVDELDDIAENAEIKRMPTFILYELGEVADKTEGPFIDQFEKMLARNFDPKA